MSSQTPNGADLQVFSSESSDYRLVFVTVPSDEVASKLIEGLLEKKLAACVNKIPSVESWYWWEGKVTKDQESILLIKTTKTNLMEMADFIKSHHPYSVPEIISVPIIEGSKSYLDWLKSSTK